MSRTLFLALNLLSLAVIVAAVGYYFFYPRFAAPAVIHVHRHAGFHVYVDGVKQDFSGLEYMSFTPCSTDHSKKLTPAELQLEKAHLHDGVGNVVHVHHQGATWGDLLQNLNFTPDPQKQLKAYSETGALDSILTREIENHESIIIVIGDQSQVQAHLKERVTSETIEKVEQSSELCGDDS